MTHKDKLEPRGKWKPQRHTKICLFHLLQSHSSGWPSGEVDIYHHATCTLAQDREMMRRRSGWRLRSCKSIRWASSSAATRVSCTVTGALHQPAGHKKMWLLDDNYLLNLAQSFLWPTLTQNNTEKQILSHRFPASGDTTKLFLTFYVNWSSIYTSFNNTLSNKENGNTMPLVNMMQLFPILP